MGSSISWIDRDGAARQRSLQLISLFNAPDSRDELGIGGVRDAIADILFPGTSTIQTRLRYMLHVPWLMAQLEDKRVTANEFAAASRRAEISLMDALRASNETDFIGSDAGSGLKRLPSSVYWAGMGSWGLRCFTGSQGQYFSAIEKIYEARRSRHGGHEDDDPDGSFGRRTWHPRLLELSPSGYPHGADMKIRPEEAAFLLDMWRLKQPHSLLTWLALDTADSGHFNQTDQIWSHPRRIDFPEPIRVLVDHGHRFSYLIKGAALLYNLQLAERSHRDDLISQYTDELSTWAEANQSLIAGSDLPALWLILGASGKLPDERTRIFTQKWLEVFLQSGVSVGSNAGARQLVESRERYLKKSRSRFASPAALRQWSGAAGLGLLSYRWPITQRFLTEWFEGVKA